MLPFFDNPRRLIAVGAALVVLSLVLFGYVFYSLFLTSSF